MLNVQIRGDSRYPANRQVIKRAVFDTLSKNKIETGDVEVSVFIVGRRKMNDISGKYLNDGLVHEVLSFPLEEISQETGVGFVNPPDSVLRLGDIILCWPEVLLLASREDAMVDDEVYKLTAHSVEHLLGKHHE